MNTSMKSTGRFALVLGALAAVFALLLLLAPPAAAQHTGTGMIPTSGGGGLTVTAADLLYLQIDGGNDMTAGLTLAAGAAATPALHFTGATTTGLYLNTAAIGFAHAGAQTWSMGAGTLLGPAGAVGTPTLSFLLDSDTGIYNSTANTVDFAIGGVRRGYVDTNGFTATRATGNGFIGHLVSHAGSGTSQLAGFSANTNGSNYTEFYATGSTYTASGPYPTNGGVLSNSGAGGLNIASANATTPVIRFMLDTPTTTIATIEATGVVPGADANLSLGTSTLSWDTIYAKTFADTAGTARFTALDASTTTITSTTPLTAGADVGTIIAASSDFLVVGDKVLSIRDNGSTELFAVTGTGQLIAAGAGSNTAPIYADSSGGKGIFFGGSSVLIAASSSTVAQFEVAGIQLNYDVTLAAAQNFTMTSGTGIFLGNKFRATDTSAADMEFSTAATDGSSVVLHSGADLAGEYAVVAGSSDTTTGQIDFAVCNNCDAASPTFVLEVNGAGDLQMDGDLTVTGGDVTVGTVGTIGASGIQTDGDLTVDGGNVGIGAAPDANYGIYWNSTITGTVGRGVLLSGTVDGSSDADGIVLSTTLDGPNSKAIHAIKVAPSIVLDAGDTTSAYYGTYISNPSVSGAGSLTLAYGLYVEDLSAGSGQIGIYSADGILSGDYVAATTYVAGNGIQTNVVTKAFADTGYTATTSDHVILCNAVGGNVVINLPAASSGTTNGMHLIIKKIDASANTCTVTGSGGTEQMDGDASRVADTQYETLGIVSDDSSAWYITSIIGTWT